MAGLDTCPAAAIGVGDVVAALLAGRAQVQVVLVEQPDQLTQVNAQLLFELAVGQACGLLITQERTDLLEAVAARTEGSVGTVGGHGISSESMFLQCDRCKIRIEGHPSRPAARRRHHEQASARTALRRNPQSPRRGPRRDRRATTRIRGGTADALRQTQLRLQGRPARPARPLHPVDAHRPGQDRHQTPHRRATRPLPTVVRQQPTTQGPRRQARDRLATSNRDRRPVDGQDRYPALDATPATPGNSHIAPHRPGIPVHQPPRSTHAADRWSTNTLPTTPISDSQAPLQGSRTLMGVAATQPDRPVATWRSSTTKRTAYNLETGASRARPRRATWPE